MSFLKNLQLIEKTFVQLVEMYVTVNNIQLLYLFALFFFHKYINIYLKIYIFWHQTRSIGFIEFDTVFSCVVALKSHGKLQ